MVVCAAPQDPEAMIKMSSAVPKHARRPKVSLNFAQMIMKPIYMSILSGRRTCILTHVREKIRRNDPVALIPAFQIISDVYQSRADD